MPKFLLQIITFFVLFFAILAFCFVSDSGDVKKLFQISHQTPSNPWRTFEKLTGTFSKAAFLAAFCHPQRPKFWAFFKCNLELLRKGEGKKVCGRKIPTSRHFRQKVCWQGSTFEEESNRSRQTEHSSRSFSNRSSMLRPVPFLSPAFHAHTTDVHGTRHFFSDPFFVLCCFSYHHQHTQNVL